VYVPLCQPWPLPPSGCVTADASPAVSGVALMAATEYLWALSGYQYGLCPASFRPCRPGCLPDQGNTWWAANWWWGSGSGFPNPPFPGMSVWGPAACGRCSGGCDCGSADTYRFDGTVHAVTEVLLDGSPLVTGSYTLYNHQLLTRTDGGQWPLCQDWAAPVTGVGAWQVTVELGKPVPALGQLALGEVYALFAQACTTTECRHPRYTTTVSRQGVTQEFPSVRDLADAGLTGLPLTDDFLIALGMGKGRRRPKVWNPDELGTRARYGGS